jgi:predicted nucleotidyltransferase component of viral defense system
MLNRSKHQLLMGQILKDIYTDVTIAPLLGFKGGTCAYFFYDLPRFSVDLDFDLLDADEKNQKMVLTKIIDILKKYGTLKDQRIKRYTVFALLSYGDSDHNIKVEINMRNANQNIQNHFTIREYLGISMLTANQEYLFACKLIALTSRNEVAMRDIYDIHFFAKNHWDIDIEVLQNRTDKKITRHLIECIALIEKIKSNQILQGLGELLLPKEKLWAKNHLISDTVFMLKNYLSIYKDKQKV